MVVGGHTLTATGSLERRLRRRRVRQSCVSTRGCAALIALESGPIHERSVVSDSRPFRRAGRGPMEGPSRYRFDVDSHPMLFW